MPWACTGAPRAPREFGGKGCLCYWDVLELEEGYLEKRFAFIAVSGNKTETVPESVGDGADQHLSEVEGKLSGSTRPSEGSGLVSQVCLLRYHDRGRLRNWGPLP